MAAATSPLRLVSTPEPPVISSQANRRIGKARTTMSEVESKMKASYPWTRSSFLLASAPMRNISGADLAVAVSRAGGIGFIAAGTDPTAVLPAALSRTASLLDTHPLSSHDHRATGLLPVGVGFICWGCDIATSVKLLAETEIPPAAVWLFAPSVPSSNTTTTISSSPLASPPPAHLAASFTPWLTALRSALPRTQLWIQLSCPATAALLLASPLRPDVLVLQGQDAGGHGAYDAPSIVPLVPTVRAALSSTRESGGRGSTPPQPQPLLLAAGGIVPPASALAALALGADGVVLGTALLGAREAMTASGYRRAVLAAGDLSGDDGGKRAVTVRTGLYDRLRGTPGWPSWIGGRGVANVSWEDGMRAGWVDGGAVKEGEELERLETLYKEQEQRAGEGDWVAAEGGRLTAYAGTAVELVKRPPEGEVEVPAAEIVGEVFEEVEKEYAAMGRRMGWR